MLVCVCNYSHMLKYIICFLFLYFCLSYVYRTTCVAIFTKSWHYYGTISELFLAEVQNFLLFPFQWNQIFQAILVWKLPYSQQCTHCCFQTQILNWKALFLIVAYSWDILVSSRLLWWKRQNKLLLHCATGRLI